MKNTLAAITVIVFAVIGLTAASAAQKQSQVQSNAKTALAQKSPYKVVILLKRKPGMSMDDFVAYYESTHSKLAEKYLTGKAVRYIRRYLHAMSPAGGSSVEPYYDVVTEMWFKDSADWQTAAAALTTAKELADDEAKLIDSSRTSVFTVDEHESNLTR
jgi:uncharacterized protein (TIGR02118 family)